MSEIGWINSDRFRPGNIVRFAPKPRDDARCSAEPGATAIVLGYHTVYNDSYRRARSASDAVSGIRYLDIFWLSDLASGQSNGGYKEEDFDLLKADYRSYRPDILPEDRGIGSKTYAQSKMMQALEAAVRAVRATGARVVCDVIVTEEKVIKEEKVTNL